jgi:hypothetical protein
LLNEIGARFRDLPPGFIPPVRRFSAEPRSTKLGRRHFNPEQVIHMLREAEIKLVGGKTIEISDHAI